MTVPANYDTYAQGLHLTLAMEPQPGTADGYPELVTLLSNIYADRVSKLPFVPSTWLAAVLREHGKDGNLLLPLPPRMADGTTKSDLPPWLHTSAAIDAWEQIWHIAQSAEQQYLTGQLEAGRAILDKAYANAAFWDALYKAAQTAAGLKDLVFGGGLTKKLLVYAGIAGVGGWLLWRYFRKPRGAR